MVEPIPKEADKLKKNYKYVISKGIWSSNIKKKLFILGNRLGSSSIYEPSESNLKMYGYNSKELKNFKITETVEIKCDTIDNSLENLNIKNIDYLKIDTQGSELEILKGMKKYNPINDIAYTKSSNKLFHLRNKYLRIPIHILYTMYYGISRSYL